MTGAGVSPNTETVCEPVALREKPRMFVGTPVYTDLVTTWEEDNWEQARVEGVTRWAVCLYRDEEEAEGWVTAEVIALSGVASEGATEAQATANVKEALKLALDALQEDERQVREAYAIPPGGRVAYVTL